MNYKTYSFYITTNSSRTVLYCGVTNDLCQRMTEHYLSSGQNNFTGKYACYWLIYFEDYVYVKDAIAREKEVKKWRREKKENLIGTKNPSWEFLNRKLFGEWPPVTVGCCY